MYDISFFFAAAAGGFILMAAVGVQAAVALFSSIPLTRRHKETCPGFNAKLAFLRVAQVSSLTLILCAVITALILHFGSAPVILGYGLGFALAFLMSMKRMSPNNEQNQKSYEESYADCYPPSEMNPDDASPPPEAAEASESTEDNR